MSVARIPFLLAVLGTLAVVLPARADVEAARRHWEALRGRDAALLSPKRAELAAAAMAALEAPRGSDRDLALRLAAAEKSLQALDEGVRAAETRWESLLSLRRAALEAGATQHAPGPWREAENILAAAARKLEAGRADAAERQAAAARAPYESARLESLRVAAIAPLRDDLVRAEKSKARQLVPRSYVRALDAVTAAEKLLQARRTLDDDVRAAAAAARYEVAHTLFLLERLRGTCDNDGALRIEGEILEWEEALRRAGRSVRLEFGFDAGLEPSLQALEAEVARLVIERDRWQDASSRRTAATDSLGRDLRRLQAELRECQLRIVELEQAAEELEAMARVQARFTRDEGRVLFENRDVILRLHGLRFPSGAADLPAEAAPLLDKVVDTIASMPGALLVVEGHTDAQGRPETNQELSERRAAAVRDWLAARTGLPPERITAVGYGSLRPVAPNDDDAGRALNRRIEITIARP